MTLGHRASMVVFEARQRGLGAGLLCAGRVVRNVLVGDHRYIFGLSRTEMPVVARKADRLSIVHVEKLGDLSQGISSQLERLPNYFWWNTSQMLEEGFEFFFGLVEDDVCVAAAIRWGGNVNRYFFPMGEDWMLISHCVCLPRFRGKGYYPELLRHVIWATMTRAERIIIDASDWNVASSGPIRKLGFGVLGTGVHRKRGGLAYSGSEDGADVG